MAHYICGSAETDDHKVSLMIPRQAFEKLGMAPGDAAVLEVLGVGDGVYGTLKRAHASAVQPPATTSGKTLEAEKARTERKKQEAKNRIFTKR